MRLSLMFVLAAAVSHANVRSPVEPFSHKEVTQQFSDRTVVAKPRASHRALVDQAEAGERVRVRGKFSRLGDLRVIEVETGETVEQAVTRLKATGRYEFVEPDYIQFPDAVPNDASFATQWALRNTGQLSTYTPGVDIKAEAAWDVIREAPNVIVAVVDSGLNITHRDLAPNLWRNPSPTFGDVNGAAFINGVRSGSVTDLNGHGSHVAGIIGAAGNNTFNISGVAWKVQLMAVRNSGASGGSLSSDSAACIDYAVAHGAHIINCSFGGASFSQTLLTAIRAARDAGVIVVTSAGNSGLNNDLSPHYPSNYLLDNLVSVGNSGPTDLASLSSDFGGLVELFAPGTSILSLDYLTTTGQITNSGTSMAAPHVAGALALLKARFPNDDYRQLINRLLRSVDRGPAFAGRALTGGRLNLHRAVTSTSNRPFNDEFENRATIVGSGITLRGNNAGATADAGEPRHGGANAPTSLWWEWTAPNSGTVTISTDGTAYDTVLAVYTGSAVNALTPVAVNDDASGQTTSVVTFRAELGVTYQIAVGGKAGASGLTILNFGASPANDMFAGAVTLPSRESLQVTGTVRFANLQDGEPRILDKPGGGSVWYRWTAPRSGRFQVAAFTTAFDTLLGVYSGMAVDQLTQVAASDDTGVKDINSDSLCTIQAVAGTTYYFKVDAKDPLIRGEFTLTVTDSLWQFVGTGAISGSPAVAADGTLYVGGGSPDTNLYAIAPDGTSKWVHAGGAVSNAAPAVGQDGTIFFGASDGRVKALKPDGTVLWNRALGAGSVSVSPALGNDGTVYLHGTDGFLYALHPGTGATLWRTSVLTTTFASAAIGPDGTIYQPSDAGYLYAIRPDGTLKWRFVANGDTFSTPALDADGNVYFTTYTTSILHCVRPDGTLRWSFTGASASGTVVSSSPTLSADGSAAYFGASNRMFYAVNTRDGSLRWRTTLENSLFSSTAAIDANGTIYVGCYDNRIYAIGADGVVKRTWDTAMPVRSSGTIVGRTLYIGSGDSKLYALDIGAEAASGHWTEYRRNGQRNARYSEGNLALTYNPRPASAVVSQPIVLAVAATGTDPLSFQWMKDGVAIPGATLAIYAPTTTVATDAGQYTVTVRGSQGTVTTSPVAVTLEPLNPPRIINFSVRGTPAAGSQALVIGFNIAPGNAKPVLIRGVGPTLGTFGVTAAMADPQVNLLSGTSVLATNDNWGGDAAVAAATTRVSAFPLAAASRDAALQRSLAAGRYAFEIVGVGGSTGAALAELYDVDPATSSAGTQSRITNVSARAQVGTGDNIMFAGFSIVGNVPRNVLIRAVGPALTGLGVTGTLADPILQLYRGTTLVASNDDWSFLGTTALTTVFNQVGAFPLTSGGGRDSAVYVALTEGVYTARVSGFSNGTGVALLEVYIVP